MLARPVVHPSPDALKAFGLGKMDDTSAAVLIDHLDQCEDCRKAVAAQSGDDFLKRLRQAHVPNSTPAPAKSLADVAKLPGRPTALHNLPPELAAHPQYEVLRELGHGGMGVVYLAKNKLMDRLEVLKVINKVLLDRPGTVERFLREIRSAAKLSHANVVGAYSALQLGDVLAFAMEYVEGEDLAVLVKSGGPLPVAHACYYIQQAALGLQHAFEKNMVHRDIKPQNLILAREGKKHVVKILDFGLAKVIREKTEDTGLTGEGQMLGTPDYIAPEQTLDAASADIRADIYSLGGTLYYLLSGRPPFSAASLDAILLAHQMQEAKLLNLLRPEVPEELAAVVRKMMAKQPARRYQTPTEVARALAAFLKPGAQAGATPKSSPDLSVSEPEAKAERSIAPVAETAPRRASVTLASPAAVPPAPEMARSPFDDLEDRSPRAPASKKAKKSRIVAVVLALALLVPLGGWLAAVMLRVETANGSLLVEMNDEAEAHIKNGQLILTGPDGKVRYTLTANDRAKKLEAGPYKIRVEGADGLVLDTSEFTIEKGSQVKIRVTLEQKAVAKKPEQEPQVSLAVLEALRRDNIPLEVLALAGDGEAKRAPASLVGVLGEAQPFHSEPVLGLAYSPDGRWLASGSVDKTILLRDAATGEVKRTLKGHSGAVSAVVFSKDGKSLISASHDGTIKLWPIEKEEEPKTVRTELGPIMTMTASPDGRFLAAGGVDRPIKLWKWGQWDKSVDLPALKGKVTSLSFSPDGALLASSWDGRVRLYQTSDGKPTQTWPADGSNLFLAFHRDGKWLVSTGDFFKLWDVASGKLVAQHGASARHNVLALHPDGKTFYVCEAAGLSTFLHEIPSLNRPVGKDVKDFREPQGICSMVFSPNGNFLAFGIYNGGVHVWDFSKGEKQLPTQGHSHYLTTLSVRPDGRTLLSGGDDNAVRRWEVARPGESKLMGKTEFPLHHVAHSVDGKKYVTSSSFWDHTSDMGIVWDAVTGQRLFVVNPTIKCHNVVFSPDGKSLVGCGQRGGVDECMVLWDADTGKQLHRFPKMGVCLDRPAFSRDGKWVAAATTDTKCVKVWEVASGEEVVSWTDNKPMCAVALSPDGRLLAAGHHDGAISLWDLAEKGRKKRTWEGHSATITRLRFEPDGKTLVSSSADGTIRLWNPEAARAREIISLGPANRPLTFDLDPSGKYLFAAGHFPVIFILRLPN